MKLASNTMFKNHLAYMCPGCNDMHVLRVAGEGQPRWQWNGSLEKPTLTPSVLRAGSCHSFINDGRVQFLQDCAHSLAGQTVELPEWPAHWDDNEALACNDGAA